VSSAIYFMAVFSGWETVLLTALVPVAAGIVAAIMLVLLFNSSSIRFCTFMIMPLSLLLVLDIGFETTLVMTGSILLGVGVVLYNLSANCGRESIEEYRAEVRQVMDQEEAVFFKAEAVSVQQADPMMMQQPMYGQPMQQQPMMYGNQMV